MYTLNYSSGVYVQEDDQSLRTTGVTTSIGASVFAANRGPANVIRPITDAQEFQDVYGPPDPRVSLCPYSILQFLDQANRCFCVRVAVDALYGGVIVSRKDANKKLAPITVTATPSAGLGTLSNGSYSYKIVAVDEAGKTLPSLAATATVVSGPTTASLTTAIVDDDANLKFTAVTTGTVGNSNSITYVDPGANNSPLGVTITPNTGYAVVSISLATDSSGDIVTTANDVLLLLRAQGTAFSQFMTVDFAPTSDGSGLVTALATATLAGGAATGANDGRVTLQWSAVTGAIGYEVYGRTSGSELLMTTTMLSPTTLTFVDSGAVTPAGAIPTENTTSDLNIRPFSTGEEDPATTLVFDPGDMFAVFGENPGEWNAEHRISITKVDTTEDTFQINVFRPGQTVPFESWPVSRVRQLDGFGRQLFLEERINPVSPNIQVLNNAADTQAVTNNWTTPIQMAGGDNGTVPTLYDISAGYDLYADPESVDIRIMINGGYADPIVQRTMDNICQSRKDCIALLDVPSDAQDYIGAINYRNNILNLDSNYSALYTCDQLVVDNLNDITLYVPPSGFIARALARTDALYGPYGFAAAGMDRGDVPSLGSRFRYNQGQRDLLAEAQVNYIRTFIGQGFKIWEQFTCTKKPSALQYLNVRMLLIFIQASVKNSLLYNVFDPNDDITRQRIKSNIEQFLDGIVAGRGLYRYKVVCDSSNNKPQDIADGLLNVAVYVDPVIPARRILLTTIITKTGAEFKAEVVSQNAGSF